ncbi:MAG: efflux RND transporter periplasmic adaptor subunit [Candidatus Melainabacteria bacterium]|nr:efflux RND transporter periplasmic adaptor subunit [Candidatus Melainabacteria bacterium]
MARNLTNISLILLSTMFLHGCEHHAQSSEVARPETKATNASSVVLNQKAAELSGIKSSLIVSEPGNAEIKTTGEIKAAEPNVFHISCMVTGRVIADKANLGDYIKAGQVLAQVQNPEVTKVAGDFMHQLHQNEVEQKQAQAKLLLAEKTLDRLTQLNKEGIAPQKDVLMAQNAKDMIVIELQGLKEHVIHINSETKALLKQYGVQLSEAEDIRHMPSSSPLRSPKAGVIIEKSITLGDVVDTTKPLYVVADLSTVWLDINVFDKDIGKVQIGQTAVFRSDSLPGRAITGHVSYIQPQAGDNKTFVARAILPNPTSVLKPGMFGQVDIVTKNVSRGAYVPDSALQQYNNESFVFIDRGNGNYLKRTILLGQRIMDGYLVKSGLSVGERVVTSGALTLKAEMLKGIIGQGE